MREAPALIREKFGESSIFEHEASKVIARTKALVLACRPFSTVELTKAIVGCDVLRDFATGAFHKRLERDASFKKDPQRAETAAGLLIILFPDGISFIHRGMTAQDGLTFELIGKMELPEVNAQIVALELTDWKEWIIETQRDLDEARKRRTEAAGAVQQKALREEVRGFDRAFRLLVESLADELEDEGSPLDKAALEAELQPLTDLVPAVRARETRWSTPPVPAEATTAEPAAETR